MLCDMSLVASLNAVHDGNDIAAAAVTLSRVREAFLAYKTMSSLSYDIMQSSESYVPDELRSC